MLCYNLNVMKMKKKLLKTFIYLFIIGCLLTLFINIYMIKSTEKQIVNIDNLNEIANVDAVLVLGCRVYSDGPSLMLVKRLERGIEVYQKLNTKLLLSGDHGTKKYDEVNTMRDYVLDSGINSKDIFLDHAGFSTYDSIYRAKYVFEAKKIVIVTQKYHIYRALYLANQLDLEAVGVISDDIPQKGVMIKNEIREILSRDKNYFKGIIKPKSKYVGEVISLNQDGNVTKG